MSENPTVNRYFEDKAMDHIDHALGRPMWPLRESYRNFFATGTDSDHAAAFRASPNWDEGGTSKCGMTYFHVTDAGRRALVAHIASLPNQHRAYEVQWSGFSRIVPAQTAAKAKYAYFLDVSDVRPDLEFSEFQKTARARVA